MAEPTTARSTLGTVVRDDEHPPAVKQFLAEPEHSFEGSPQYAPPERSASTPPEGGIFYGSIKFGASRHLTSSKFTRVRSTVDAQLVMDACTTLLQTPAPCALISIPPSRTSDLEEGSKLALELRRGIAEAMRSTNAWVLTMGHEACFGARTAGRAIEYGRERFGLDADLVCVGFTPMADTLHSEVIAAQPNGMMLRYAEIGGPSTLAPKSWRSTRKREASGFEPNATASATVGTLAAATPLIRATVIRMPVAARGGHATRQCPSNGGGVCLLPNAPDCSQLLPIAPQLLLVPTDCCCFLLIAAGSYWLLLVADCSVLEDSDSDSNESARRNESKYRPGSGNDSSDRRGSRRSDPVDGAARCPLPAARCPLFTAHRPLPNARCPMFTPHRLQATACCPLPASRCLLPSADCSLITALCSLLSAAHRLRITLDVNRPGGDGYTCRVSLLPRTTPTSG